MRLEVQPTSARVAQRARRHRQHTTGGAVQARRATKGPLQSEGHGRDCGLQRRTPRNPNVEGKTFSERYVADAPFLECFLETDSQ